MRGRRPKPSYLRVVEGDPGKRGVKRREPQPQASPANLPVHLSWLDAEAKACWNRLAPELLRVRCLTLLDQESLAIYCSAWSRWVRCRKILAKKGESYTTPGGLMRPRPEVAIAAAAEATVAKIGDSFGLTPLGRSRLRLPPPEQEPSDF